jgi:cation:H+ antiporter
MLRAVMDAGSLLLFAVGVVVLVVGADVMVRGAARIAARTGLSSVVIGLTVVAFGTSAPELAVSIQAAVDRKADLALGNVVGSNIANVLLVLGLSAAVGGGLVVHQRIVRLDVPIMIVASFAVLFMALDGSLSRFDGAVLVAALVIYTGWTVWATRRSEAEVVSEYDEALDPEKLRKTPVYVDLIYIIAGLAGLVVGARWLVSGAVDIAKGLGVSDLVIGLTVVAVGTSMPEIATSVIAAVRGERDLAVGNAIGSNIFNIMSVLGISALVSPIAIAVSEGARSFDLPVMIAVAIACLPVFFNGYELKRWEGFLFLGYYGVYVAYLVSDATNHPVEDVIRTSMTWFVLPLTAITLGVVSYRELSRLRASRSSTS